MTNTALTGDDAIRAKEKYERDHVRRVLDHGFVRLVDSMGSDLSIARAARVSYDAAWRAGENHGSDARLIKYLWRNHHTSPFEAVTFTFEVKAPIFVFRQWHRHRTWCLSGDSLISFELPNRLGRGIRTAKKLRLDDLFRKWNDDPQVKRKDKQKRSLREFRRDQIRKMKLRVFDEKTRQFTVGHICDVIAQGAKQVFEITLADGKTLKCTDDHRLLTPEGWQPLKDVIGLVVRGNTAGMTKEGRILTNGVPAYQSKEWMTAQRATTALVSDIATAAGCSYHTIRKWLRIHGLQFSRMEVAKRKPIWNHGVRGYKVNRVLTDAERQKIRESRSGKRSNWWKGGVTSDRMNIGRWTTEQAPKVHAKNNWTCQSCGERGGKLHAHHIKPVVSHPELARDFDNLTTLCVSCHRAEHFQSGEMRMGKGVTLTARPQKIVKVKLVGEEPTYDISVAGDNHNFVANGIIVHNCFNEVSARYTELPEEFYTPEPELIGVQSASNKQARDINPDSEYPIQKRVEEIGDYAQHCMRAFALYRNLLAQGWPRELARSVLPVATHSHMFATVNLLNLFKFCTLRSHSHSQYEIRVYSDAMLELIRPIVPVAVGAYLAMDG
jgi:thymidylate synthase (FAD)